MTEGRVMTCSGGPADLDGLLCEGRKLKHGKRFPLLHGHGQSVVGHCLASDQYGLIVCLHPWLDQGRGCS